MGDYREVENGDFELRLGDAQKLVGLGPGIRECVSYSVVIIGSTTDLYWARLMNAGIRADTTIIREDVSYLP